MLNQERLDMLIKDFEDMLDCIVNHNLTSIKLNKEEIEQILICLNELSK